MTPLESIRTYGLEKLGRYYSQYRAMVLDPQPDDKNIGNILVHIPRVQGGMKAIARAKDFYGGPGFGFKGFTPQTGETVWISFENGNPTKPLWSYHTWGEKECPEELKDIHTFGVITPNGNKLYIRESEEENKDILEVCINDTSKVNISKDNIDLSTDEVSISLKKDSLRLQAKGTYIEIKGNKIYLNGQSQGLVDINSLKSFITAVQTDLALLGSGTNVATWLSTGLATLENKNILY